MLEQLLAEVARLGKSAEVSVYSQGSEVDFTPLKKRFEAQLYLDRDPVWTMQQLIDADILTTAKSSFSYVAALVSKATVIYEPFWHAPLPSWIVRSDCDGTLPAQQLTDRLRDIV